MRKTMVNFWVDVTAFAAFVGLAVTGVMIRFLLPAGSGHFATLWGLSRHDWGAIHFWIAATLMATLALHLVLHWGWIAGVVRGRPTAGSGQRVALACVGLLVLLGLALAPFVARVEYAGEPPHKARAAEDAAGGAGGAFRIEGSMTLQEVAHGTGVPVAELLRALHLPPDTPPTQRLGRLRQQHGLEMEAVRRAVADAAGR